MKQHNEHTTEKQTSGLGDKRRTKWFWMYNEIPDEYAPILGPCGIAIYVALSRHANADTRDCFPSYRTLARKAGCSPAMAVKAVKLLCECNIISKTTRTNPDTGRPTSNMYLLLDRTDWRPVSELKHLLRKNHKRKKDEN